MIDYKLEIAKSIEQAILKQNSELKVEVLKNFIETPPNSEMGEYAFPCFRLAKDLKKSPQIIAADLKLLIDEELNKEILSEVKIVGGYLNFYIDKLTFVKNLLETVECEKDKFGATNIGNGKNVIIEYSSPNIAKPFHIGHLRSTVIGGALYKLYNFVGYNSVGINYLGDWGLQFGKVMAGLELWKNEYDFSKDEIGTILKVYVRYSKEEKENPELTELARKMFKRLEDGEPEIVEEWEHIRKVSLENYEKTYKLLNAKFDSYNGEAYYNDKMQSVISELNNAELLKDSEGAKVVFLDEYNMPPCIIVTSAGTTIYATRDLAALKDRIETYDFAKAIYVVGSEQELHFRQVFKTLELAGDRYKEYVKNCIHVPFGLVVDKNGEKIGSRKGNSVTLEGILNESIEKVKKIIDEKNAALEDRDDIARKVGVGAIIFNDLSNSRIKNEIFDWDMLLNFNGETGPYVQYIYVRTKSILDKAGYIPRFEEVDFNLLTDNSSIEIFKLLYNLRQVILNAVEKNEPSILARFLIDLSQCFSNFYNENRIIGEEKNVENSRLYLTKIVGDTLKNCMGLLGIEMPNRM